jgi:hypothetical protein
MPRWCGCQRISAAFAVLLAAALGCGGGTEPPEIATLEAISGNAQVGVAGRLLPEPLVVALEDSRGNAVADHVVQFSVTQGGGEVSAAETTTDANGHASVNFTLGASAGAAHQVTASTTGSDLTATFNATATTVPISIRLSAGTGQTAKSGLSVPTPPAVRVLDAGGTPVAGVAVAFQVVRGGGTVTSGVKLTDASGIAAADEWLVGPSGVNTVEATVEAEELDGEPVTFVATTTPAAGFDITVRYLGTPTSDQVLAIAEGEVRWEGLITSELSDGIVDIPAAACGEGTPAINEVVDDLLILASFESIDGPGGTLARAGPCVFRDVNGNDNIDIGDFPGMGTLLFDAADIAFVEENGALLATVIHEMGHVLGFGGIWGVQGLLADPSRPPDNGTDPHFTGAAAIAAFDLAGGTSYSGGLKVPVENTGGTFTADVHWRESVMGNELMTGYLNFGPEPLSDITLASFEAQGYTVDHSGADAFTLDLASLRIQTAAGGVHLENDISLGPIWMIDRSGRITSTIRR